MTTIYLNHNLGLVITDSRATVTETEYSTLSKILPRFFKPKVQVVERKIVGQKSLWIHDRLFTASGSVEQIDLFLNHLLFGAEVKYFTSNTYNFHSMLISKSWVLCIDCEEGKIYKQFYCVGQNGRFNATMGSGAEYIEHLVHGNDVVKAKDITLEYAVQEFRKHVPNDIYSDANLNIHRFKELHEQ